MIHIRQKNKKIRMRLLLRSINCENENCKSTEEYFQTHVQKCCDKEKKKSLDMYQTYCIMCSKKLGIEFDREDSGMLFYTYHT